MATTRGEDTPDFSLSATPIRNGSFGTFKPVVEPTIPQTFDPNIRLSGSGASYSIPNYTLGGKVGAEIGKKVEEPLTEDMLRVQESAITLLGKLNDIRAKNNLTEEDEGKVLLSISIVKAVLKNLEKRNPVTPDDEKSLKKIDTFCEEILVMREEALIKDAALQQEAATLFDYIQTMKPKVAELRKIIAQDVNRNKLLGAVTLLDKLSWLESATDKEGIIGFLTNNQEKSASDVLALIQGTLEGVTRIISETKLKGKEFELQKALEGVQQSHEEELLTIKTQALSTMRSGLLARIAEFKSAHTLTKAEAEELEKLNTSLPEAPTGDDIKNVNTSFGAFVQTVKTREQEDKAILEEKNKLFSADIYSGWPDDVVRLTKKKADNKAGKPLRSETQVWEYLDENGEWKKVRPGLSSILYSLKTNFDRAFVLYNELVNQVTDGESLELLAPIIIQKNNILKLIRTEQPEKALMEVTRFTLSIKSFSKDTKAREKKDKEAQILEKKKALTNEAMNATRLLEELERSIFVLSSGQKILREKLVERGVIDQAKWKSLSGRLGATFAAIDSLPGDPSKEEIDTIEKEIIWCQNTIVQYIKSVRSLYNMSNPTNEATFKERENIRAKNEDARQFNAYEQLKLLHKDMFERDPTAYISLYANKKAMSKEEAKVISEMLPQSRSALEQELSRVIVLGEQDFKTRFTQQQSLNKAQYSALLRDKIREFDSKKEESSFKTKYAEVYSPMNDESLSWKLDKSMYKNLYARYKEGTLSDQDRALLTELHKKHKWSIFSSDEFVAPSLSVHYDESELMDGNKITEEGKRSRISRDGTSIPPTSLEKVKSFMDKTAPKSQAIKENQTTGMTNRSSVLAGATPVIKKESSTWTTVFNKISNLSSRGSFPFPSEERERLLGEKEHAPEELKKKKEEAMKSIMNTLKKIKNTGSSWRTGPTTLILLGLAVVLYSNQSKGETVKAPTMAQSLFNKTSPLDFLRDIEKDSEQRAVAELIALLGSKETSSTDVFLINRSVKSLNLGNNESGIVGALQAITIKDILSGEPVGILSNETVRAELSAFVYALQTIEHMCKLHKKGESVFSPLSKYDRENDTRTIFELLSQSRRLVTSIYTNGVISS
ncbi:MAG: hypothetical protein RI935_199 [Candidatus Parcubacteria bacterium]|jgi:hypothetical protein